VRVAPLVHACLVPIEALDPDPPQRLHDRHLAQPRGGVGGVDRLEQPIAVGRDGLGQRLARRGLVGQAHVVDARAVALNPRGIAMGVQPVGGRDGEAIEGVAHGLADAFKAIDRADGGEHMGRVRALLAARFE